MIWYNYKYILGWEEQRLDTIRTTQEQYKINGEYTMNRQVLHQHIISYFMSEDNLNNNDPEAILLGGGTASGKSKLAKLLISGYAADEINLIRIDPDEIKNLIPEFRSVQAFNPEIAADFVHDESSDIANDLLSLCIRKKVSFIYDGTMKNFPKYQKLINRLINEGYTVTASVVDVPIEVAREREHLRYLETKRKVNEDVLLESHRSVPETFYNLKDLVHEYIVYDATEDGVIVEIAEKTEDGVEIIHDAEKLERFYEKSGIKL